MKVNALLLVATSLVITACGGGGSDSGSTETSADTYNGQYVWNEIDKTGGGRRWQCYDRTTGKAASNSICNNTANIPQYDYYPG